MVRGERSISEAAFRIPQALVETWPEGVFDNFFRGLQCHFTGDGKHINDVCLTVPSPEWDAARRAALLSNRRDPPHGFVPLRDREVVEHWSKAPFVLDHAVDNDQCLHVSVEHSIQRRLSAELRPCAPQPAFLGSHVFPVQDGKPNTDCDDIAGPFRGVSREVSDATLQHEFAGVVPGSVT